jgi:RHS repeat-associated protein
VGLASNSGDGDGPATLTVAVVSSSLGNGSGGGPTVDDMYINRGDGTFYTSPGPATNVRSSNDFAKIDISRLMIMDWNGDGLDDVVYVNGWGSTEECDIYLNPGDGFATAQNIKGPGFTVSSNVAAAEKDLARFRWIELSGDRGTDLYVLREGSSNIDSVVGNQLRPFTAIESVTDGLGATVTIEYAPMTNPAVYSHTPVSNSYPLVSLPDGSDYRVLSKTESNGIGGSNTKTFHYENQVYHLQGGGLLGFGKVTTTEPTGAVQVNTYSQDFDSRTHGQLLISSTYSPSNAPVSTTTHTLDCQQKTGPGQPATEMTYYVVHTATSVVKYNMGIAQSTTVASRIFDEYGNVLTIGETATDEFGTNAMVVTNTYDNRVTDSWWMLGLMTSVRESASIVDEHGSMIDSRVKETEYRYNEHGLRVMELSNLGDDGAWHIQYDEVNLFGEAVATSVEGHGINGTVNALNQEVDARGQFVVKEVNNLGEFSEYTYDGRFGSLESAVDVHGLESYIHHDSFGRDVAMVKSNGCSMAKSYAWAEDVTDGSVPSHGVFRVTTASSCAGVSSVWYDRVGHEIRHVSGGLRGAEVYEDFEHDTYGREVARCGPYLRGVPTADVSCIETTYDEMGRVVQIVDLGGGVTSMLYAGNWMEAVQPLGRSIWQATNVMNWVVKTVDSDDGGTVLYEHDATGNLYRTTDPNGQVTTREHDVLGRIVAEIDPDMGTTTYTYDALNNLLSTRYSDSSVELHTYDSVGRRTQTTGSDGVTMTWVYDSSRARNGASGNLLEMSRLAEGQLYRQTQEYNSLGQAIEVVVQVDDDEFVFETTYDECGRVATSTMPTGLVYLSEYDNTSGAMVGLTDADGNPMWTLLDANADGHVTSEAYALAGQSQPLTVGHTYDAQKKSLTGIDAWINGGTVYESLRYEYDLVGNMLSRSDATQGLTEEFTYDTKSRIVTSEVSAASFSTSPQPQQRHLASVSSNRVDYDLVGNIVRKGDVGEYTYGENGAGPHAVTSIAGGPVGVQTFEYNTRGQMTRGLYREYEYFATSSLTRSVRRGTARSDFAYSVDGDLVKRIDTKDGATMDSVTLSNAFLPTVRFEKVSKAGTVPECTTYVSNTLLVKEPCGTCPGDSFGECVALSPATPARAFDRSLRMCQKLCELTAEDKASARSVSVLLVDHLKSPSLLVDSDGNAVERYSYDMFGQRRQSDWAPDLAQQWDQEVERGFTGHQSLNSVDLVHTGPRLYDSFLGRFSGPDMVVATSSQGHNRYTYGYNNPLVINDPSGHFFGIIAAIVAIIVAVAPTVAAVATVVAVATLAADMIQAAIAGDWANFAMMGVSVFLNIATMGMGILLTAIVDAAWAVVQTKVAGGSWGDSLMNGVRSFSSSMADAGFDDVWLNDVVFTNGVFSSDLYSSLGANGIIPADSLVDMSLRNAAYGTIQGGLSAANGQGFQVGFTSGFLESTEAGILTKYELSYDQNGVRGLFAESTVKGVVGGVGAAAGGGAFETAFTNAFSSNVASQWQANVVDRRPEPSFASDPTWGEKFEGYVQKHVGPPGFFPEFLVQEASTRVFSNMKLPGQFVAFAINDAIWQAQGTGFINEIYALVIQQPVQAVVREVSPIMNTAESTVREVEDFANQVLSDVQSIFRRDED